MWVYKKLMDVVENVLVFSYQKYSMMHHILYLMSHPWIIYVAQFVKLGHQNN